MLVWGFFALFVQGSTEKQNQLDSYIESYFKKLAPVITDTGKYKTCGVAQQTGDSELMLQFQPKGLRGIPSCSREPVFSFQSGLQLIGQGPLTIMEGNLLYSKSINLNINLI